MLFPLTISIIALNLALGFPILLQSKKDVGAKVFFATTFVFSILTYVNYNSLVIPPPESLFWIRMVMFFAAIHTFLFFVFVHLFGHEQGEKIVIEKRGFFSILSLIGILLITISPYLFKDIEISADGRTEVVTGILMPVFALWLIGILLLSIKKVWQMYHTSSGNTKEQWKFLLIGTATTYGLLIMFNFVFSSFLNNSYFVKFTPLFSLPVVIAVGYAVVQHNLFNMKIIATQAFVSILIVVFLSKTFFAQTQTDRIGDIAMLLASAFFGVLLVRSVKQEVYAREQIQDMAQRLTETNWELAKTNERLRVIDQRKSEFVSIVSHQLRTPITAIKGYASLLLEDAYGVLSSLQRTQVEKVFISSNRLAEMVNDFLDISKIEQGTMKYEITTIDVKKMLIDLFDEFLPVADKKGLTLDFACSETDSFLVDADAGKLRQIFSNILDNSIKYTPTGSIIVSLEKTPATGEVVCKVKDSGIGLSQDDLHHLFGKFTRGSQGQSQNTDGSGLGLYIAQKMLEAMKGKVWVDSEGPGKGSTFVIVLAKG